MTPQNQTSIEEILKRYPDLAAPRPAAELPPGHKLTDEVRPSDESLNWYLLRTATRQEGKAEASLIEVGASVYLPRLTRWQGRGPERKKIHRPLAPGFMFAGLGDKHTLYQISRLEGVHNVVRFRAEVCPPSLPFSAISKALEDELAGKYDLTQRSRPLPEAGDPIAVVDGLFKGFTAEFVRMRDDERIEVLLGVFGSVIMEPEELAGFADTAV